MPKRSYTRKGMLSFKSHPSYWVTNTENKVHVEEERSVWELRDWNCPEYLSNEEFVKGFRVSKQMFRAEPAGDGGGGRINGTLGVR